MKLYLMQHGQAMTQAEDPERPLNEQGKDDVQRVAACLARSGIHIDQLCHSGKRRAADTAEIVAQHLGLVDVVMAVDGLNPMDDVRPVAELMQQEHASIMLVGHLPFLSRLANLLLTGDPEASLIRFQMGGVVCLERQEERWQVYWMIIPEILP
jgi:phosphohistidine phosphatase